GVGVAPEAGASHGPGCCKDHHQDQNEADDDPQYIGFIHGLTAAAQTVDAVGRRDDVGDADAVLFVDDHHLALGDQVAVHENIHGFAGQAVEFHHRALAQLQNIADGQPGTTQFDSELDRNVHDHVDVGLGVVGRID